MEPRDDDFARIAQTLWADLGRVEGTLQSIRLDLFTLSGALARLPASVPPGAGMPPALGSPLLPMPAAVGLRQGVPLGAPAPSGVAAPRRAERPAGGAAARAGAKPGAKPRTRRNGKD